MPRNGSGQYSAPTNSWNLAVNGTLATAGDWQAILDDLVSAMTQSVSRDGQSPMTGNLNMGNNKINGVSAGTGTGQALAFEQLFAQGTMADLASAATTDIGAQNTNFLRITGNTTITSFGTNYRGPRFLVFEGAVTLTNSSTLVLPGGANITTAAGDVLIAIPGATLGTADKWIVVSYQKANTSPGYANIPGGFGFRNRIINGDMRIDQRNNGAIFTPVTATLQYTLDRWGINRDTAGATVTVQQSSIAPAGFTNSFLLTVSTGASAGASDQNILQQSIEGFNAADLGWGTASAQAVTISFWVRSSVTGTYGLSLSNSAANRAYLATYTINAANTFELKTITIPGDTTGTWLTNSGIGIRVRWDFGSGSSRQGAAGSWGSTLFNTTSAQANVIGTTGATFYITGVQLEAGTVATPFERRDYGRELMMCQRYYALVFMSMTGAARQDMTVSTTLPVTMRTTPMLTRIGNWTTGAETGTLPNILNATAVSLYNPTAGATGVGGQYTASSEL